MKNSLNIKTKATSHLYVIVTKPHQMFNNSYTIFVRQYHAFPQCYLKFIVVEI